jgi:hypothetical protein
MMMEAGLISEFVSEVERPSRAVPQLIIQPQCFWSERRASVSAFPYLHGFRTSESEQ